jgi:ankyrin repeat protein
MSRYEKTLKDRFWHALVPTFKNVDDLEREFHFAALTNKLWRADYLLSEKNVDVNSGNGFAIRFAVDGNHWAMVQRLIEAKADLNVQDGEPLIKAAAKGFTDIAVDLLLAGADPSLRDCRALRLADAKDDIRLISAILKSGKDVEKGAKELLDQAHAQGDIKRAAVYKEYLDGQAARRIPARPPLQGGPFNPKK